MKQQKKVPVNLMPGIDHMLRTSIITQIQDMKEKKNEITVDILWSEIDDDNLRIIKSFGITEEHIKKLMQEVINATTKN